MTSVESGGADAGELFGGGEAGGDLVDAVLPHRAHSFCARRLGDHVARTTSRRRAARAAGSSRETGRHRRGPCSRCRRSAGSRACGRTSRPRASSRASRRRATPSARPTVASYGSAQWGQSRRASRWASTAETAAPVMNGSTPISFRRVSADGASFVCSVESTMCPVSAASIEMRAVSPSRISPTMTTSGSERRIDRSAVANVSPARGLICTWLISPSRYSTGSSTVMMLISGRLMPASDA